MEWLRWYHGATSDTKWPIIARRSGQTVGVVVSIWAALLEHASQHNDRGSVEGFDCEALDALYGYEDGVAQAVMSAMETKGVIEGGRIAAWSKRQPKREDDSSERVRAFRERQKADYHAEKRECNAGETHGNEKPRAREQSREEQSRERQEETPTQTLPLADQPEAAPAGAERVEFYLTRKKRKLTGKRLVGFERFWSAYGYPKGKAEAADAWLDIPKLTDALVAQIVAAAEHEARQRPALIESGRTPKMAQGWLSGRRWEDADMLPASSPPPTTPVLTLEEALAMCPKKAPVRRDVQAVA